MQMETMFNKVNQIYKLKYQIVYLIYKPKVKVKSKINDKGNKEVHLLPMGRRPRIGVGE